MRGLLILLTILTMGCSASTIDEEKEKALVIEQLILKINESLKLADSKSAATPVPLEGEISVTSGDVIKSTKDEVVKHYQEQIDQIYFNDYEFLDGPTVTLLGDKACYVTFKIHWTYTLKGDSTKSKKDFVSSSLLVGQKRNGVWETVATSQTNK